MKPIDIDSLLQARASLNDEVFASYLKYHDIDVKAAELDDLEKLVDKIRVSGSKVGDLADFFVGYRIPQIGKEFDLLRFGESSIVNIELKSESAPEKIRAQLLRNRYYLGFIGCTVYAFTFVSSLGKLFHLDEDGKLETTDEAHLIDVLAKQTSDADLDPDLLFDPSDYLVSPFNSTNRFLAGEYFLTHQQEQFKTEILTSIEAASGASFLAITGSAGTGKTLLTFDIAKHLYAKKQNVLIVHCGLRRHHALVKQGWRIAPIKNHQHHDLVPVDLVIIDEAQRIKQNQLDDIVARVQAAKCSCIFSYDKVQTLSNWEAASNMAAKISSIPSICAYKLSEKIRTNKEIASFIKLLFSNKASAQAQSSRNIKINYFDNSEDAKTYLSGLDSKEWEVLRFTPSQYNTEHHEKYFDAWSKTSHQVIGQEFDGVAIAIDKFFAYDATGALTYAGGAYYAPTRMLFQNITRARRRLNLVIIGNQEMLKRCLTILK